MTDLSHIYTRLHENRYEHVIRARRERELQAELTTVRKELETANKGVIRYAEKMMDLSAELIAENKRREDAEEAITIAYMKGVEDGRDKIVMLRRALEPFAKWADKVNGAQYFDRLPDDHILVTTGSGDCDYWIYMQHLRAARKAYDETK
jgi:hypothetical protein